MKILVILIITAIIASVSSTLFCPEGMFWSICGHHECRFSCTHPRGPKGCIPKCGPPGCTCLLHLVMRETDGKCVKKKECTIDSSLAIVPPPPVIPPLAFHTCPGGMFWDICGHHECRFSCAHPLGPKGCIPKCGPPGCTCLLQLVLRETDRKCVRKEECPVYSSLATVPPPPVIHPVACNKCPEGMFWDICGHHKCRFSCAHPLGPKGCIPKCGPPGCTCLLHLVMRESDGKCVKKEDCPIASSLATVPPPPVIPPVAFSKCPEGMFWDVCGHHQCRFSCAHPLGPKGCIPKCGPPGCTCLLHLVMRETDGKCVKKEDCPIGSSLATVPPPPVIPPVAFSKCPEGMFWDVCGHHQCRFSCAHPLGPKGCIPKCGPPGCTCLLHLVMRETDGKCVKKEDCPIDSSLATVPPPPVIPPVAFSKCPEGMFWDVCGHHQCRFSCAHPLGPKGCIPKCGPPGCTCLLHLVMRETGGKCVKKEDCPIGSSLATVPPPSVIPPVAFSKCPEGMFWDVCGHHQCRFSCAHPLGPKGCIPKCGPPGCTCLLHMVMRESDGKCVKKEDCPIDSSLATVPPPSVIPPVAFSKCPEGMFWDVCGHHQCRFSCAHPIGPKGCIPKCGPPGCTCLLHLVMRETDGKCVKKEDCPIGSSLATVPPPPVIPPVAFSKCPEGMFWDICGHHQCRFSCAHPLGPKGCIPKCGPSGCTCLLHLVMRETDGKCVKKEDCPMGSSLATVPPPPVIPPVAFSKCPEGMFWDVCGHHQCRFSCAHPIGPKGCIPKCGPPGCTCLLHLVMRETDGKCVKKEDCPIGSSLATVPPPPVIPPVAFSKCPEGMFWDICGHHQCRFSCAHHLGPKGCIPKCGSPGCTCLLHLVMRETDGKCVKKGECNTYNPPALPPQGHLPYPPHGQQPYPPQPGRSYPPQEQLPYPPQPGQSYPPKEQLQYPPQEQLPYPPQEQPPYPPNPGRSYPPQPGRSYPPQEQLPYPPQPGQSYPPKEQLQYPPQEQLPYYPQKQLPYPPQPGRSYPPQRGQSYPPKEQLQYPPQEQLPYYPQKQLPHPPQPGRSYPPQRGQSYPPKEQLQYPPQEQLPYHPQEQLPHPPQPGRSYPPQPGRSYPPQEQLPYPPQPGQSYPPKEQLQYPSQEQLPYPPQEQLPHPPQPGRSYPPQPGRSYPPQPGRSYPPQERLPYPPQPGRSYPPQPWRSYPPQELLPYPPQPGPPYPDKPEKTIKY